MKTRCLLRSIYPTGKLATRLRKLYPEGWEGPAFRVDLPGIDPRWPAILDAVHSAGITRWQGRSEVNYATEYHLTELVEWESSDFARSPYARLIPRMDGMIYDRNVRGELRMGSGEFPMFASVVGIFDRLCVHERIRKALLEQEFIGVSLKRAVLFGGAELFRDKKELPWKDPAQRFWELTSSIEMPWLSKTVKLVNQRHEPLQRGDYSQGCRVAFEIGDPPEKALLRYKRRSIAAMKPFDLARTRELFGIRNLTEGKQYIASTRFREFCMASKWKVDWEPVIVE